MEKLVLRGEVDRKEAILAGKAEFGEISVSVTDEVLAELTPDEREWLALSHGGLILSPSRGGHVHLSVLPVREGAWVLAALRAAYAQCLAFKAAEDAEIAKEAEEVLALDPATIDAASCRYLSSLSYSYGIIIDSASRKFGEHPRALEHLELCSREVRSRAEERAAKEAGKDAQARMAMAAKEAAEAAKEAADSAEFAAYVEQQGTDSQRKRFGWGVLPAQEIVDLRRNELLPVPDPCSTFIPLDETDIECSENCCGPTHKFASKPYDGDLSDSVFEALERIREKVLAISPSANVQLRRHTAWCSECDGQISLRFSVRATVTWAGHVIQRLYRLDATSVELNCAATDIDASVPVVLAN
jgi:hypothetical protein